MYEDNTGHRCSEAHEDALLFPLSKSSYNKGQWLNVKDET
ncbi:hypothetical protein [Escherichia phage 18-1-2]|nr:hypothetical protein [Escherichia phage 18-1-2]UJQ87209.1 hypothetical protein [Escherichia phage 24-2-1]UJQ87508.1 hypothetical protein [Escherichia phage 19-1-2]UOX40106.1 hypothetical protein [Escherichia phage vB_EcoM_TH18]